MEEEERGKSQNKDSYTSEGKKETYYLRAHEWKDSKVVYQFVHVATCKHT